MLQVYILVYKNAERFLNDRECNFNVTGNLDNYWLFFDIKDTTRVLQYSKGNDAFYI